MTDEKTKFTEFEDDFEDETAKADDKSGSEESGSQEGKKADDAGDAGKDGNDDKGEAGKGADDKDDGGGDGSGADGKSGDDDGKKSGDDDKSGKDGDDDKSGKKAGDDDKSGKKDGDDDKAGDDDKGGKGSDKGEDDKDGNGKGSGKKEGDDEHGKEAGKDADGDDKSGDDKSGEKKEDFFAPDDDGEKGDETGKDKVSYKPLAKEFGIELENDTQEELTKKVNEKLEASKLEFKLDGYSDQARSLIKYLNEDKGDIGSFLTNPTVSEMQGILNMEPEDKVRMIRMNEMKQEGKTEEQAITEYGEELDKMSVSDIRKMSDGIDKQAKDLRDQEIVKITGDKEVKMKTEKKTKATQVEKEKTVLKTFIQGQEDFLGIELTPKARAQILSDLETGKFDELVEKAPEASRFFAYMTNKYGSKIMENFSKGKKDAGRAGYNEGTDKQISALHNDKKSASGKAASGHQQGEEGTKKNFATWEDDLFEPDEE